MAAVFHAAAVIVELPFGGGIPAWAELGAGADVGELVDAALGRSAESMELESGGTGFDPDRKIPVRPPETARAGALCQERETDSGERISVILFSSVSSR